MVRVATTSAVCAVIAALVAPPAAAAGHASVSYEQVSRAPGVPAGAQSTGAASSSREVSGAVALAPRDSAGLEAAAAAVSDPRSPSYHDYLARGEFAEQYGATASTIDTVESTLRDAHLTVTSLSGNHLLVHFSGTVANVESAFHTSLADYRTAAGRTGIAPTKALSFPSSIAPQVVSVVGLDTLVAPSSSYERGNRPGTKAPVTPAIPHYAGAPDACSAATGAANEFGGLTDDQIAHAYGVDGLYQNGDLGAGETVAIYELEPFARSDIKKFDTCYYGKAAATAMLGNLTETNIDGGSGTGPGSGESLLDIDDVSGLAPGAHIHVYEAPLTNAGALDEYAAIVQADSANVISTSWGFCETDATTSVPGYLSVENDIFEQAALQGQTVFAASGDSGAEDCVENSDPGNHQRLAADDPSSQPFVTGVGGTTITDADNHPSEQVWNDGGIGGGGGGGSSAVWGAPSWQQPFLDTAAAAAAVTSGALTPCDASATAALCRETPDVTAQADEYTGAVTVYAAEYGGWNTFGGTSSSTPLWAAMLADIDASSGCEATGPIGFVSPSLYAVASTPASYKASFNDITVGNNDVFDTSDGADFAAHTGYDMASGLGSPVVTGPHGQAGLAAYLCAAADPHAPSRPSITEVSPSTVAATPAGPVTLTGSGFTGAKALSVGGFAVPSADWSVTDDSTIVISTVPTAAEAGNGGLGPQDGTGLASVSVTGASGATSFVSPTATLLYVDGTADTPIPSVEGVSLYGGSQVGGNTVTVYGSGFTTTGPDAITGVTVGGVAATDINVITPTTLTLVVPAYQSGTVCATATDPATDVCQAQVQVSNLNGDSAEATILPPYSGAPFKDSSGGRTLPACVTGGSCEIYAAASEYDYFPTPIITSITTTSAGDGTTWASEAGTTIATIDGSGFDIQGLDWVDVGKPTVATNQDFHLVYVTPTEIQVVIPRHGKTTNPVSRHIRVQTLGGQSNARTISYAGIPKTTGVSPAYVPDSGGGHVTITGKAFDGIAPADGGELSYLYRDFGVATDQHSGYDAAPSTTSISVDTPGNNPGEFIVSVCTVTGCSLPTSAKKTIASSLDFYEPGDPVVTSVSTKKGPASGGTTVVITGHNLSDAVEVDFGHTAAEATSAPQILTNGSNTEIDAISPPGTAGSKVHIVVTTVESIAVGHPSAKTSAATFTYKASVPAPPRHVMGTAHHTSITVKWKKPASDGGHHITKYRVRAIARSTGGKKTPPTVTVKTKNGKARSAKLTGLRGGWTYRVKVQAVNSLGHGLVGKPNHDFTIRDPA
jgi:hypothetical protein